MTDKGKRIVKWWSARHPEQARCPVIISSRIGFFQCEMNEACPHGHGRFQVSLVREVHGRRPTT